MKVQFDPFIVEYDKIEWPIYDFKTECINAVHKAMLSNTLNLPVVVMMSGGIDSQLIGESLLLASIPFKCVIGRLQDSSGNIFNKHDYEYAERWCYLHGIDILYCDIDVFIQSDTLVEYALSAKTFSPQYACHMYIMRWCSDKGYFFLAGNGEMDIVLRDNKYYMMDEQREFSLLNFCRLHNLTGEFQFWKQDGRLISAFLQLPTVKMLMSAKIENLLDHKHACFSDVFRFEERVKCTGFEHIQKWDNKLRQPMKKIMGKYDDKYYTLILHFQYNQKFIC
jgi:hypothetical protein